MILYELCGENEEIAFSPYCWRTKMALKHKGLDFEALPSNFTKKEGFADSGSKTVPVIKDGDKWLSDSWHIAKYLDKKYPENPLFACDQAMAQAKFINDWTVMETLMPIFKMLVADINDILGPDDQAYFRETREPKLGMTLEETRTLREDVLKQFHDNLKPLQMTLTTQDFISGDEPAYADYIVFGSFQWARQVSAFEILDEDTPVGEWRERMLDLFDGYARKAPTV
jgi:glutathione S-transferase